jgi:hypothetical protein
LITTNEKKTHLSNLENFKYSIPWHLLTKMTIHNSNTINESELKIILGMAYNVDTLEIFDHYGVLRRKMLRNTNDLGTCMNKQVRIDSKRKNSFEFSS